jgi:hypothetical protein
VFWVVFESGLWCVSMLFEVISNTLKGELMGLQRVV